MIKLLLSVSLVTLLVPSVFAAQVTANFIVPFDPVTRQTALPLDKDGQPVKADRWHLAKEKGNLVMVQVRADEEDYCGYESRQCLCNPDLPICRGQDLRPLGRERNPGKPGGH